MHHRELEEMKANNPLADLFRITIIKLVRGDGPDLSARQLGMFLTCYSEVELQTVRGLADKLHISKPAITRGIDTLSRLDLVRREIDPLDRRSVLMQRTASGTAFHRALGKILLGAAAGLQITARPNGPTGVRTARR
jgi:DNA-binding MarR family transcriptional regulator